MHTHTSGKKTLDLRDTPKRGAGRELRNEVEESSSKKRKRSDTEFFEEHDKELERLGKRSVTHKHRKVESTETKGQSKNEDVNLN